MRFANRLIERFDAIMFDLDGTLVDTMPLHYAAYAEVMDSRGLHLSRSAYMALIGPPAREALGLFVEASGGDRGAVDLAALHDEKKVTFERIIAAGRLAPLPAFDILMAAAGKVRCGLVSSGNKRGVSATLNALGWSKYFDTIVTGDDVMKGKPDPEPYRLAAELMKVSPARCVALEDAPAGLASARAAGMIAYDVTNLTVDA